MPSDPFRVISLLERKHPRFARWAVMKALGNMSPFNRPLGAKLVEWDDRHALIEMKRRYRLRNHVGSIHAGALFTLGETCAGLVIVRNFPFEKFRPLMSDVRVTYSKQARGDVAGRCEITPDTVAAMKAVLDGGEIPTVEMVTTIFNREQETIAVVTTVWQVKPWQLVKTPTGGA